ncbi:hypothetical protein FNF31_01293 [Cafeteria roenbergensis]|uniref:NAD+ kinase n=1 Tax=Cafeteria roenbergensis TaxID=33653 RepID=A0A5A8DM61_CAFRO|nr:hypothetical protein FNF31_01293 [Cafeteria roenbergensis]
MTPEAIAGLDLIVCIGGDGTVLHTSSLFQGPIPPVISVGAGSLGFMTVFDKPRLKAVLRAIFEGVERDDDGFLTSAVVTRHPAAPASPTGSAALADGEGPSADHLPPPLAMPTSAGPPVTLGPAVGLPLPGQALEAQSQGALPGYGEADAGSGTSEGGMGAGGGGASRTGPPSDAGTIGSRREPATLPVTMRMRLRVDVFRAEGGGGAPAIRRHVLNELALERGSCAALSAIDAYVDGVPLTTIQADGVIIGTPTGSTAYSLAAGGSMALPSVPAILLTPICPHTLSFRPVLFPDCATIKLVVAPGSRSNVRLAFDGRVPDGVSPDDCVLRAGDFVVIRMSAFPLPLVTRKGTVGDWVRSITEKLNWNVRERQKAAVEPGSGADGAAGASDSSEDSSSGYESDDDDRGDHHPTASKLRRDLAADGSPVPLPPGKEGKPGRGERALSGETLYHKTRPRRHDSTNGYVE